jgi:site-specific DNA recombinase
LKGIAHAPAEHGTIDPRAQETLLQAIARSRSWMDAVLSGKTASFDEIAAAERLAERHVRRLVPLAFLSPKIIQAIADGTAPAGLTVSNLTQALPHAWTAQEQMLPQLRQAPAKRSELTGVSSARLHGPAARARKEGDIKLAM